MYVYFLSRLNEYFNLFGVVVKAEYLPIISLAIEFLMSGGMTKSYYGYIYGALYFFIKGRGVRIPAWFSNGYIRFKNNLKVSFRERKGIKLGSVRKKNQ